MNFLIDAHLPPSIGIYFEGQRVIHTSSLEDGNETKDRVINLVSVEQKLIVITKDTDFYYSYLSARKPNKLVLVKLGNMRIKELRDYFATNAKKIIELMEEYSFIILERDKIRVLE